ncbi:MAG TPA: ABC transporter substrate-binding protein [Burkholderiales bacterium]|nr:ABC transporter substrate-binding protein [Burkholderiales bacterium]
MRIALILLAFLPGCGEVWNDPYPASERGGNILYSAFEQRPKHLDPVQSYTSDESRFTRQVYEPPLQYHYLKRPYELVPLTAAEIPRGREIDGGKFTVYEVRIRPGIRYQPHPAFIESNFGLPAEKIRDLESPYELSSGTRELVAEDYVYQVKRLAHPRLHSPVLGLMSEYIVGMREYAKALRSAGARDGWLDLRQYPLEGAEVVNRYTYRITLKGRYPQFVYWLAMPFFSPVPWEAEKFFHQPGMAEKNFTLDWWPVGTGPYMLVENNPNARMVLERNPSFRGEAYPAEGEPEDAAAGLLADAGGTMPFVDRVVFSREKEAVPYWSKFLQGYYDEATIGSDQFDQAVRVSIEGAAEPSAEMLEKGIRLSTLVSASTYYFGFNMKDPLVGGSSERARKLRQAISIAVDVEEYLSIFQNGRGVVAHSPIPPGIFGRREGAEGINPVTHVWRDGRAERRPIEEARGLLAEAGYPGGRDPATGAPLLIHFDTATRGPGDKPRLDWWRKQLARLGIQLEVRDTDWNRFQEKIRKGTQQMYGLGWAADYPDAENFLFLLHGPQARADGAGANSSNYGNPKFDALFERMKSMANSPERQKIIDAMVEIARRDAPWVFGFHPKDFSLRHAWLMNAKPNDMAGNTLKYLRLDVDRREALRHEWNAPVLWPLALVLVALASFGVPALRSYRRRERMAARQG